METVSIDNIAGLPEVAGRIIGFLNDRPVVAFYGPMGVGKTTLIREIAARMGVRDSVSSPTFALVNQYSDGNGNPVFHFDFYRIDSVREAFDLGYEEYFYGGGVCLIEWPDKVEELLPEGVLKVEILQDDASDPQRRTIKIGI